MVIEIRSLAVEACHGALAFEKREPQPFVISASLEGDYYYAAVEDDLSRTVNYAEVCELIERTVKDNSFNLIEKLAAECAFRIMEKFPSVGSVTLRVEKPRAPVAQKVETLAVSLSLTRETAVIALGSSIGDRRAYLDFATDSLKKTRGIDVLDVSDYITTEPYGGVAENMFLNGAVKISTFLPPHKLLDALHAIENAAGRTREKHWGDRTLDLDIIFYGKRVIRDDGLIVPHPEYFKRDFVLIPLKQIAGDFVCPLKGIAVNNL